uniref:Uncharacterized protein n=1 Tax=Utricularia reniformis TaxID=192314 RepID=A0A1Y0AZJ2_9LAMI|nr:hypothetical protein AEK19_MT0275 [Utricularia reniformis]ART30551.1 hypothetical protein AEK19_MT0275 [Utricularia reniformis]
MPRRRIFIYPKWNLCFHRAEMNGKSQIESAPILTRGIVQDFPGAKSHYIPGVLQLTNERKMGLDESGSLTCLWVHFSPAGEGYFSTSLITTLRRQ